MKKFYALITFILMITVPAAALAPTTPVCRQTESTQSLDLKILNSSLIKYDDILDLLKKIENEAFVNNCDQASLDKINQFLSQLANAGIDSNDPTEKIELDQDIQMLFRQGEPRSGYFPYMSDWLVIPALFHDNGIKTIECRSWFSKQWKNTKKFVKKHKKAILIGAAVIVTVTAVVYFASALVAAKTAAAATAAASASASNNDERVTNTPRTENQQLSEEEPNIEVPYIHSSLQDTPHAAAVLSEGASAMRESISEMEMFNHPNPTVRSDLRESSARLAHDIFDGVVQLAEPFPRLADEFKQLADRFFPDINLAPCPM